MMDPPWIDGPNHPPLCEDGCHVFDLGDDAVCDICGVPKREVVNIEEYKAEWDAKFTEVR